jgi:glycosyltransferase involved in cell wall biosynthesis
MPVKVSFIVPVFNCVPYIARCLDSILAQTFADIEIIAVDDGSTDGSGELLGKYADKDTRIKVIYQPNQGVASARNVGLDVATGEYVAFVDADDYISPRYTEVLYNLAVENGSQLVLCDFSKVYMSGISEKCQGFVKNKMSGSDTPKQFYMLYSSSSPTLCNKLFSRNTICQAGVRFCMLRAAEDWLFCTELSPYIRNVSLTDESLYFYVQRQNSASHSLDKVDNPYTAVNAFADKLCINLELGAMGEDVMDVACIRAFIGLMFSSDIIGQGSGFFFGQIKHLRKWGDFSRFCRKVVFTPFMKKLCRSGIIAPRFALITWIFFALCLLHMDWLCALMMVPTGRLIVWEKRKRPSNY